ncbi:MAG: hypothetical protein DRJ41_01885 [Thermoprotei archaeon]|nr:MAG: hypothetical protein DRJ41_01885 [Thermoprotei archaeon]
MTNKEVVRAINELADILEYLIRLVISPSLRDEYIERIRRLKERVNDAHSDDTGIMDISKGEPYPFPY